MNELLKLQISGRRKNRYILVYFRWKTQEIIYVSIVICYYICNIYFKNKNMYSNAITIFIIHD